MRAARSFGVALSVLRGKRAPADPWLPSDSVLAVALQILEDTPRCPRGHDLTLTTGEAGDTNDHTLHDDVCAACALLDEEQPGEHAPGTLRWVTTTENTLNPRDDPDEVPPTFD